MTTVHLPDGSVHEIPPATVEEIAGRFGLNPYEVLATSAGMLLMADEVCDESADVYLTSIVHGG